MRPLYNYLSVLYMAGCLPGFGQSSDSTGPARPQGCTFAYSLSTEKSKVCFGDSLIFSQRWTCLINEPAVAPPVCAGMTVQQISKADRQTNYLLSFRGPGKYVYTFAGFRDTITVHDPLEQADPLSKDRFCKNDPPFTLSAAYSGYSLGTTAVTVIDPYSWDTGVYKLRQSANARAACRFELTRQITITEPCSASGEPLEWIYPNPAKELVTVRAEEGTTIRIIDLYGKIWGESLAAPDATKLNLESLPAGLFMVEYTGSGKSRVARLIHL